MSGALNGHNPELHATLLRDGHTESGCIRPVPGLHAGLRFVYRPMLVEQVGALSVQIEKRPEAAEQIAAAAIAKQLISWELTDKDGQPLPIKPENLLRLRAPIAYRLRSIVQGLAASDLDETQLPSDDDLPTAIPQNIQEAEAADVKN